VLPYRFSLSARSKLGFLLPAGQVFQVPALLQLPLRYLWARWFFVASSFGAVFLCADRVLLLLVLRCWRWSGFASRCSSFSARFRRPAHNFVIQSRFSCFCLCFSSAPGSPSKLRLLLAVKALFSSVLYRIRLVASAPSWIHERVPPRAADFPL
jgi:hypothetical protein